MAVQSRDLGFHEWASYCSQQAAEKAIKALVALWSPGLVPKKHEQKEISKGIPTALDNEAVNNALTALTIHNEGARYPDVAKGAPCQWYTPAQSQNAIQDAKLVVQFVEKVIAVVEPHLEQALLAAAKVT